jgi:hypothetical protein
VRAFFETPCIDWIIANGQFQDLFYEHCSLFSAHCLALALRRSGFGSARVIDVFDGQYLWAESGFGSDLMPAVRIPVFSRWEHAKSQFLTHWKRVVADAAIDGPVYLWGGGSKGVTFALLVDADGDRLAGVVDINPVKQGGFRPISGRLKPRSDPWADASRSTP